ncbi:hypothetical protein MUN81_00815 [Hymenobacter sp. 5317J-9]|uniref:hypothetical protein n=1 Tax=Hymenobacter sp. 5317J-9 TaxID=2932250 RepID=UPI001FD6D692|nr:hypothetical protein [Hymenobacter sp. 5317J-9]UOQ98048.1 hypothetical protein MUN81_00815 [Hymenobacter sp. 5317J-9]
MQALRSHLALLLLLCLTRTLLPEAWILALHPHAHTTDEPTVRPGTRQPGKAHLSAKHQHCEVEQFYDVAYQPAAPTVAPLPRLTPHYPAVAAPLAIRPAVGPLPRLLLLRGPPSQA